MIIYLISVLSTIRSLIPFVIIATFVGAYILLDMCEEGEDIGYIVEKWFWIVLIAFCLYALIPSKEDMYMIFKGVTNGII